MDFLRIQLLGHTGVVGHVGEEHVTSLRSPSMDWRPVRILSARTWGYRSGLGVVDGSGAPASLRLWAHLPQKSCPRNSGLAPRAGQPPADLHISHRTYIFRFSTDIEALHMVTSVRFQLLQRLLRSGQPVIYHHLRTCLRPSSGGQAFFFRPVSAYNSPRYSSSQPGMASASTLPVG